MQDEAAIDAFMNDLLSGLDGQSFSSPTASGSFKHPRTAPSPWATKAHKRPRIVQRPSKAVHSSPVPPPSSQGAADSLQALPPTPKPFWSLIDGKAQLPPTVPSSSRRTTQEQDENSQAIWDETPTRARHSVARSKKAEALQPELENASRAYLDPPAANRPLKYVGIEVEPVAGAKKARPALSEKGVNVQPATNVLAAVPLQQPPPQSDFDYFDGDIAFDDHELERAFEVEAVKTQSDSDRVPISQRFIRCTIESVTDDFNGVMQKKLTVSGDAFDGVRTLVLEDDWAELPANIGDTINVLGDYDFDSSEEMRVSRKHGGLIILHPDILVSSTKAADSSHCTRKAVLQELIRTVGDTTPSLIYGNMLHSLMQACMLENRWDDAFREGKITEIVKQSGNHLFTVNLDFDKAREELTERSKELEAFADRFVGDEPKADAFLSDPQVKDADRCRLAIRKSVAEEEDIWSPRTGLKGKIDVTTLTRLAEPRQAGAITTMPTPFEIKTGRTSAGMEHRAQTMLYTLLMEDRYDQKVDTGLLMYTQSNDVFAVRRGDNELRGLIMARNRFASYLNSRVTLSERGEQISPSQATSTSDRRRRTPSPAMSDSEAALWSPVPASPTVAASCGGASLSQASVIASDVDRALLPPPVDEVRACKRCYVGNACRVFRRSAGGAEDAPANDELRALHDAATGHLTDEESAFFARWDRLITFEEQELARFRKEIWTLEAEERESLGRCLANMVINEEEPGPSAAVTEGQQNVPASAIHRWTYRLRRKGDTSATAPDLLGTSISVGDPIVVSLETPRVLAVARGFVHVVSLYHVEIGLDRKISELPQLEQNTQVPPVFRIDKDELTAGMGRIRDNLLQLFYADADERRRKLIIGLEAPHFDTKLAQQAQRVMPSHLNEDQRSAIERVLSAQDYALILGMPGTGKTTTTAEIIRALARTGKSVLLTSYTHSAVDNILLKLVEGNAPSILRLGNSDKILPSLRRFTLSSSDYATSLTDIEARLMRPQIVATTCLGINEAIFSKRQFDVCIVDEASQVTLPTCLGPLRFAKKFVLVGDHNQLPPLVRNKAALSGGLDVSLFKRLSEAHPDAVVNLSCQYRMNSDIMSLSNKLVYGGRLKVGTDAIGIQQLVLPNVDALLSSPSWVQEILGPQRAVIFADTDALPARERREQSLIDNASEAALIKELVAGLTSAGAAEEDIAVITPYRQQVKLIAHELSGTSGVEILTADRSQGRDKECIIISLVRSNTTSNAVDLLKDRRRINVCLTRAKSKLIIIGSRSTVASAPVMKELLDLVQERRWIYNLPADALVGSVLPSPILLATKPARRGGGARALKSPLVTDILNQM
ncbi:hypothetical protein JCM10908_003406 [Rhodotorula pacifica]|uniref:bifunctional ATP-dependent DNA helicase/ssDNA endodeoxyribonuclease DNA2 n=1 Tax=Rhodotorula pacifica TaxID=1495444 RepID=UPI003172C1F2